MSFTNFIISPARFVENWQKDFFLRNIGQTYYISDPRHVNQHPEAVDEELGESSANQANSRLTAGKDVGEPYCMRVSLLIDSECYSNDMDI